MKFGTELLDDSVRFRLWAPKQTSIELVLDDDPLGLPMDARPGGWHELATERARAGTLYKFRLPDGREVPDPASWFQPQDVHGPSEVVDPRSHRWRATEWSGRPWHEAVLYELHVGAFTPEGTFLSAIDRLDHLVELGITGIELMPIGDFPGARNWGYDGVLLFAPDSSYGRPEDLKRLIDETHARGLMVILDVIYNHFGPDGNYLPVYAPIFNEAHETPWGAAVNFDGAGSEIVREFVIANALYWLEEFRLDGLRFDAVHAIADGSPQHILESIASRARASQKGSHLHLILENEHNQASWLARNKRLEPVLFTAQWNDDLHHALHVAATGETAGYYAEYEGDARKLGRALAEGFAYQGETMEYKGGPRGEPSGHLPPFAFVSFIQNHDQIGNRAFGERLSALASGRALRAIAAIYLLAPQIPLLFMGEEWASSQPFLFFCDFEGELATAVSNGRRQEFARFPEFQDPKQRERIPDPSAIETFSASKLMWNELGDNTHAEWLSLYRDLLRVRHQEIVPRLEGVRGRSGKHEVLASRSVKVEWRLGDGSKLLLYANLQDDALAVSLPKAGHALWTEGEPRPDRLGPWTVVWILIEHE